MSDRMSQLREEYRTSAHLDARIALHTQYSRNPRGWYRWLFDHIPTQPTCQVLDIGCGSARLWTDNLARIPVGWNIVLMDLSPGMTHQARRQLKRHPQFAFVCADAQSLPFCEHQFDVILATHMLYHVADRSQTYTQVRRLLASNGRFLASANGRNTMKTYDELVQNARSGKRNGQIRINDAQTEGGFNLERGAQELAQHFSQVAVDRYEDAIVVQRAEPLVAYAQASGDLAGDELDTFRTMIDDRIRHEGILRIEKQVGVFTAQC